MRSTLFFRLGRWVLPLVLLFSTAGRPFPLQAAPAPHAPLGAVSYSPDWQGELRGFWVDIINSGLKNQAQIDQLIADAHAANANALFVQVRRRGESFYNDSLEPRDSDPALDPEPFDPLASVIEAAHSADPPLQVHAWVVTFHSWGSGLDTDPERHVYYLHGCAEDCTWDDPENWVSYGYNGYRLVPSQYLDPGHPAVSDYLVQVFLHLVRNYDIDGLHLDYVRYPESSGGFYYGYNSTSVSRFNAFYGREGLPSAYDPDWQEWRREQVTRFVRRLYLEVMAVKPSLVLSTATIAWGASPYQDSWWNSAAYNQVFQDWLGWLQEGIIDLAVPMNYDEDHYYNSMVWYDGWIEWEKNNQYDRAVAIGPGIYLNYIGNTLNQIYEALAPSYYGEQAAGVVLYSYASTNVSRTPNSSLYQALSQPSRYGTPPFSTWVNPPILPWKANPTKGHLMGWAIGPDGPLDRVSLTYVGPTSGPMRTDGNGFFGAVDLPPGDYIVEIPGAGPGRQTLYGTVQAGQVTLLDWRIPVKEVVITRPSKPAGGQVGLLQAVPDLR